MIRTGHRLLNAAAAAAMGIGFVFAVPTAVANADPSQPGPYSDCLSDGMCNASGGPVAPNAVAPPPPAAPIPPPSAPIQLRPPPAAPPLPPPAPPPGAPGSVCKVITQLGGYGGC
jgi:hypothetical protein